jgi:hypothetical protein
MKEARRCRLAPPRRKLKVNYAEQAKRYADELAAKVFGHAAVDGAYTTSITCGCVIVFALGGSSSETSSAKHTISPAEDIVVGLLSLWLASRGCSAPGATSRFRIVAGPRRRPSWPPSARLANRPSRCRCECWAKAIRK